MTLFVFFFPFQIPESIRWFPNGTLEREAVMPYFPMATLVYFQFTFAAITLVLVAGSVLGRMNIKAWMAFVPLWLIFSYTVGAYSLWGGGFLYHWGVIDYSGGYVIHLSSGVAGFVAAYWVSFLLKALNRDNVAHNWCGTNLSIPQIRSAPISRPQISSISLFFLSTNYTKQKFLSALVYLVRANHLELNSQAIFLFLLL